MTDSRRTYTLVTGATGMIGSHLLADLYRSNLPVAVLVRASGQRPPAARISDVLERIEQATGRLFPRPVVIEADLRRPGLGITDEQVNWLATHCSRILHSAGNLSFRPAEDRQDGEPFRTNVDGTAQLIDLSRRIGVKEFHYVSTAYVCGCRNGVIREVAGDEGQAFSNDYERSKILAEGLLRNAAAHFSLTIYRPSIVIDPWGPATADRTIQSVFWTYCALRRELGRTAVREWFHRLGLDDHKRKNIVTAQWTSRTVIQILRRQALHGRTYHVTHDVGTSIAELESAFERAYDALPATEQQQSSSRAAAGATGETAAAFVSMFAPYLRDDPVFDRQHLDQALAVCDEPRCPTIDIEDLLKVVAQSPMIRPHRRAAADSRTAGLTARLGELAAASWGGDALADRGVGIVLLGDGGGEWTVWFGKPLTSGADSLELTVRRGIAGDVRGRLQLSTGTLARLVDLQLSWDEALQAGLVLVEHDGDACADMPLIGAWLAQPGEPRGSRRIRRETGVGRAE